MKRRTKSPNSRDKTITRFNIARAQQERAALQLDPFTPVQVPLISCIARRSGTCTGLSG